MILILLLMILCLPSNFINTATPARRLNSIIRIGYIYINATEIWLAKMNLCFYNETDIIALAVCAVLL